MNDLQGGFLIVYDGIDGVGKSKQIQLAQQALQADWPVELARNLGGTPIGEELRKVIKSTLPRPETANLYISAAIQEALLEEVARMRQACKLILMDRGPLSLAAYEIFGSDVDRALAWPHVERGMAGLKPDMMIIYEADIQRALGQARQQSSDDDYFENKPIDYFEKVAQGYKQAASEFGNIVFVDANRTIDEIHRQTMELINQALAKLSSLA